MENGFCNNDSTPFILNLRVNLTRQGTTQLLRKMKDLLLKLLHDPLYHFVCNARAGFFSHLNALFKSLNHVCFGCIIPTLLFEL